VWSIDHERIWLSDDYARLLPEAGFSSIDAFGSYRGEAYSKRQSEQLILVARKGDE
jgi:hypothetical protein